MSSLTRILCVVAILLCCLARAGAQDKAALAQVLKSETDAAKLVSDLQAYATRSPWDIQVTALVSQRLAVKGLNASQIIRTITASGDMAAALDVDDEKFAEIAWLTGLIVRAEAPAPLLYNLESLGVPAFDLLAEVVGQTPSEIREAARRGELRSEATFGLLTANYSRRYKGMAEKLLLKRRNSR